MFIFSLLSPNWVKPKPFERTLHQQVWCFLPFSLSIKITTESWLYSYSHKSTANQGLSTSEGHRNTRTHALNPKHGQADHLPWSRQDLLARISLTCFQLNWHLLAHRQKKIPTDCCYFSVNPICSIQSNLLCTLPAIVNLRHTWHLIFSYCHLPSVVM